MYHTALVTGATRGIGRALVKQLTDAGLRVVASGRDQALLDSLARETGAIVYAADLTHADQVEELYRFARERLGAVEILINNAGANSRKAPLTETTVEEFDLQYALNLRAPYLLAREALKEMQARRHGYIINVISTAAKTFAPTMGIYSAMKYGLHGLSGVMIKEAREHNVKVCSVYPGGTDTGFRANPRPDYMRPESVARMILQVLQAPEDIVMHELTFRPIVETNF
jgi:NAD(P)-dependent dehydrogenase (short-subunit alcohol dehydrogenase family)